MFFPFPPFPLSLPLKLTRRLRDHRLEGPQGEAVEREVRLRRLARAGARARVGRAREGGGMQQRVFYVCFNKLAVNLISNK